MLENGPNEWKVETESDLRTTYSRVLDKFSM